MIPALVLTAGLATRLRPLSRVRAKAAVPVAGLGDAPRPPTLPPACVVPEPYVAGPAGIWRRVVTDEAERLVPVASSPIYLVGRAEDADTGERWADLAWRDEAGGWRGQPVARATVSDSRSIVALSSALRMGLPGPLFT